MYTGWFLFTKYKAYFDAEIDLCIASFFLMLSDKFEEFLE